MKGREIGDHLANVSLELVRFKQWAASSAREDHLALHTWPLGTIVVLCTQSPSQTSVFTA